MNKKKVSVVIPYLKRLENIGYVFKALSMQTMDSEEFEVVVGAMEYCTSFVEKVKAFEGVLNIRTVMTDEPWKVGRARNLAMKQAEGEVLVFLDADILLPYHLLDTLYKNHFSSGEQKCIIGQMLDYDEGKTVENYTLHPFEYYQNTFLNKTEMSSLPKDIRWTIDVKMPWAFCWTALMAVSRKAIVENNLYFDQQFKGWGVEDIEWGYRIQNAGLPISFPEEIWSIHLPHKRNVDKNHSEEAVNFHKFLKKSPDLEVEIVWAVGDVNGNKEYGQIMDNIQRITESAEEELCVVEGDNQGEKCVIVGALKSSCGKISVIENQSSFQSLENVNVYSLVGLRLPFENDSVDKLHCAPVLDMLDDKYKALVAEECRRVSKN